MIAEENINLLRCLHEELSKHSCGILSSWEANNCQILSGGSLDSLMDSGMVVVEEYGHVSITEAGKIVLHLDAKMSGLEQRIDDLARKFEMEREEPEPAFSP